jgi:hypothetical protein
MFAFDFSGPDLRNNGGTAGTMYIGKNGVWFGTWNPGTSVGGMAMAGEAARAMQPVFVNSSQSIPAPYVRERSVTFNFGATAFAHALPAGYSAWDSTPIPAGGW